LPGRRAGVSWGMLPRGPPSKPRPLPQPRPRRRWTLSTHRKNGHAGDALPKEKGLWQRAGNRLGGQAEARVPAEDEPGWCVLAPTVGPAGCSDAPIVQAYRAQTTTGEPGLRWSKHPAAIAPVWREKPERIAA